jgi:hypothetical protein
LSIPAVEYVRRAKASPTPGGLPSSSSPLQLSSPPVPATARIVEEDLAAPWFWINFPHWAISVQVYAPTVRRQVEFRGRSPRSHPGGTPVTCGYPFGMSFLGSTKGF